MACPLETWQHGTYRKPRLSTGEQDTGWQPRVGLARLKSPRQQVRRLTGGYSRIGYRRLTSRGNHQVL